MEHHHMLFRKVNLWWRGRLVLPLSPSEGPWYSMRAVDHPHFHNRAQDGSVSGIQVKMRVKLGEKASCAWSCSLWAERWAVEVCWGRMPHTSAECALGTEEQRWCKGVTRATKLGMQISVRMRGGSCTAPLQKNTYHHLKKKWRIIIGGYSLTLWTPSLHLH